jgi:hypothetical protein
MKKYTEQEMQILKDQYHQSSKDELLTLLNPHSWSSIKDKAKKLGLCRKKLRNSKISLLLPNTLFNCYWWGFILSDGHISDRGELVIQLHEQDKKHLLKISNYIDKDIQYLRSKNMVRLTNMDIINSEKLKHKLGIKKKKTYNPPDNFDFLQNKEERIAFLIGFIDGDGSISYRKGSFQSIRIIVHENWFNVLNNFCNKLVDDFSILKFTVSYNKRKNTQVCLHGINRYKFLKDFIISNKIPSLERKWKI